MFVLAHLSDPHIAPLPAPRLSELASKRVLGFLNWHRKRRAIHQRATLDAIVGDLRAQSPDHVAITGDLVNISLAAEFEAARRWLASVGPPASVSVVPGNHDAYVRAMAQAPAAAWGDYMRGDSSENGWPYVRRRGPVALIGVSTAVATPPFMATGRAGGDQIARLGDHLRQLGAEKVFRIVLIHYPLESEPRHRRERLVDSTQVRAALAEAGAELVLHGHQHMPAVMWADGPSRIPVVGVPSASAAAGGRWHAAAYNLYRIEGGPGAWRCEAVTRGLDGGCEIVELGRRVLVQPRIASGGA